MSKILFKSFVVSPPILGATLLFSTAAFAVPSAKQFNTSVATTSVSVEQVTQKPQLLAQTQKNDANILQNVKEYSNEGQSNSASQVTSVSQFSDVQPTDWAFQALQSLVERYGCIAGYPNGTYRGNRALTRYEFAAGLNACLDRVNELIATATADLVTKEDLATLQRLQEEFSAELATLRGRVDSLEARTAELEANQFSTTTKLKGEAIFALTDAFGDNTGDNNNAVFQNRVRLSLNTSFTGQDKLITRLTAGNANQFDVRDDNNASIGTAEGLQTFNITDQVGGNGNDINLDRLTYEFPFGPVGIYVAATGGRHSHYAAVNNPYFFDGTDGGNGALSTFASEPPIFRIGGGAGASVSFNFGEKSSILGLKPSSLRIGYLASEADNPGDGQGVFNGDYAALGQLNFGFRGIDFAATYVHGLHSPGTSIFNSGLDGATTGTRQANLAGLTSNDLLNGEGAFSNSYGLSASVRPSDRLSISGFVSFHDVTGFGDSDDFEAWSYGLGIALPDLGKPGNVLGIYAGAEPYAANRISGVEDGDTPFHIEGFYKYQVSENVSITPGLIWLTAPGQDSSNSAVVGTLRTTFTF
ncbi:MAG: iron uptake porin [Calothrix sp. MO_167.B42]|nr:iron uptake porin [Calothrix sp. MO_167.B42]